MRGNILVHIHCYRADEMATMLDLAEEFGFKDRRVPPRRRGLQARRPPRRSEGVCGALWADWWGFKMEAYDGIQENIAIVDHPQGGCAIVHSDSDEGIQRLNQEAAKAMTRGKRAGLDIPPERAIRWVTSNPAQALGIPDQTGTLEAGKMGDVVIWNGTPFSVYALADQVFIDGVLLYDRAHPAAKPRSDFSAVRKLALHRRRPPPRARACRRAGPADPRRARAHGTAAGTLENADVLVAGRAHRGHRQHSPRPRARPWSRRTDGP